MLPLRTGQGTGCSEFLRTGQTVEQQLIATMNLLIRLGGVFGHARGEVLGGEADKFGIQERERLRGGGGGRAPGAGFGAGGPPAASDRRGDEARRARSCSGRLPAERGQRGRLGGGRRYERT